MVYRYMAWPAARNALWLTNPLQPIDYNPTGDNAGGTQFFLEAFGPWPAGEHGLCGDPYNAKPQSHHVMLFFLI